MRVRTLLLSWKMSWPTYKKSWRRLWHNLATRRKNLLSLRTLSENIWKLSETMRKRLKTWMGSWSRQGKRWVAWKRSWRGQWGREPSWMKTISRWMTDGISTDKPPPRPCNNFWTKSVWMNQAPKLSYSNSLTTVCQQCKSTLLRTETSLWLNTSWL